MRWLLILVAIGGCGKKITPQQLTQAVWMEVCPGSNPETSYIKLRVDGSFEYSYPAPDEWNHDQGEAWSVDGDVLTVSWNEGFAVTKYDLAAATADRIPGVSSKDCGDRIYLLRDDR